MPAGVRAARSATITGFCAFTSMRAPFGHGAESPCRRRVKVSLRNVQLRFSSAMRVFLQAPIGHQQHGHHRRVIAIL